MALAFSLAAAGDLHLGSSFAYLDPAQAEALGQAQVAAFYSLGKYCARQEVAYLFLTGDIFDKLDPTPALLKQFQQGLKLCPRTQIILLPGNHDPYFAGGLWDQVDWPSHLHIIRETGACWQSPRHPLRVYAAPFTSQSARQSLFEDFRPQLDQAYFNVLLLHGDLVKPGQESRYNPIPQAWLADSGLDLVLLGHHHQSSGLLPLDQAGTGYYLYPGCLLGRGFDEVGPKGFYAGQAQKVPSLLGGRPQVKVDLKFVQAPGPSFYRADLQLNQLNWDPDQDFNLQVREAMLHTLKSLSARPSRDLFSLQLKGTRPGKLDSNFLQQALADEVFYLQVRDLSQPAADWQRYSQEPSLRAQLAQLMLDLLASPDLDEASFQSRFLSQEDELSRQLGVLRSLPRDQQQVLLSLASDKLYAGLVEEA